MSWGERSCCYCGDCIIPNECNMASCNVDCRCYQWNGYVEPDSESSKPKETRSFEEISQQQRVLGSRIHFFNRYKNHKKF